MSAQTNDIAALRIGGSEYTGWETVSIVRSIENACSTFNFSSTVHDPATRSDFIMRTGAACEIYINDKKVITGYIDEINPSHDSASHGIPVSGRSKTADIVDCSAIADSQQMTDQKIEDIAGALCAPYSTGVLVVNTDTGDPVKKHVIEIGETVYESIERLARQRSLLLTDDSEGNLILTQVGALRAADQLVLGENILKCDAKFSAVGRYSEYRAVGQRSGDDNDNGKAVTQSNGVATDGTVERTRILIVTADEQADDKRCADRAAWEAATRAGKSVEINVTVQGWTQSDGALWEPNMIVHITDEIIGVDDDMLIVDVNYDKSGSGTTCAMKLAPEIGFMAEAPDDQPAEKQASAKTGYWKELA